MWRAGRRGRGDVAGHRGGNFIDTDDLAFWFDDGITLGYPAATDSKWISFAGHPYSCG